MLIVKCYKCNRVIPGRVNRIQKATCYYCYQERRKKNDHKRKPLKKKRPQFPHISEQNLLDLHKKMFDNRPMLGAY